MITLEKPIERFGGIEGVGLIDRLEIVSFAYHREPDREPHLDIGVRVGRFVEEVQETIESKHAGFQMNDVEQAPDGSLITTRTCHDCRTVEVWDDVKSEWEGNHDMDTCLAAKPPGSQVVSEAHIHWYGGTSIIVKGDDLEGLGIGRLESEVGGLIHSQATETSAKMGAAI